MARPTTKAALLKAAEEQFQRVLAVIESLSPNEREAPFSGGPAPTKNLPAAHWARDKNLRDVVAHLTEWHQLLLRWTSANLRGDITPFLPAPYNWRTYGQLNEELWREHQGTTLDDALGLLAASHEQVLTLIRSCSEEELFERGVFSWTGSTTLGSFCVSATSSHYAWALTKIRTHLKHARGRLPGGCEPRRVGAVGVLQCAGEHNIGPQHGCAAGR